MSLFITKKATVIYKANKLFLCLVLSIYSSVIIADADLNSYCFDSTVNLKSVEKSISFLLLPKDTVNLREEDHCIDLVVSPDRGKLFEKFLSGRYNLKRETVSTASAEIQHCQLALKTTVKQNSETDSVKVGEKNSLNKTERRLNSTSTMELVFRPGVPGEMEAGPERLNVICRLIDTSRANLQFSFSDKTKGGLATEAMVTRGEWLNIGSIVKELNDKNKTMGIPQTEVSNTTGKSETIYELQLK